LDRVVREILTRFEDGLEVLIKTNIIETEHLETTKRNRLGETHSLVLGLLCRCVYQTVSEKYIVALGHGLKTVSMKHRFSPDISLWKSNGDKKLVGILDYESTNSSDSRIIHRNFTNYRSFIESPDPFAIPDFWVIITTLPSKKVSNWYSWNYRSGKGMPRMPRISKDEYLSMLNNPFRFCFSKYTDEFNKLEEMPGKCPLYIINLDGSNIIKLCLPIDEKLESNG